jgi:hypothetical protein
LSHGLRLFLLASIPKLTFATSFAVWYVAAFSLWRQKLLYRYASTKTCLRGSRLKALAIKPASILCCEHFATLRSNYSLKRTAAGRLR